MSLSTATAFLCLWLLAIGLIAVHMEVRNVRCGVRIRELLRAEELAVERLRDLQLEYHARARPDRLEAELAPEFRTEEGYPDDGRVVHRPPVDVTLVVAEPVGP